MFGSILAIAWKDLQVFFKDRGALAILFLMPILFSSLFSSINQSMYGDSATPGIVLEVSLVNEDAGPYGEQVATVLHGMDMLRIESVDTVERADQQVADGGKLAAIVIPADFSAKIDAYEPTQIQVIVNPTQQELGGIVTGLMNFAVTPAVLQGEISYGIRTVLNESGVLDKADPAFRRAVEAQNLGVIMTQIQAMADTPLIAVASENLTGAEAQVPFNFFSLFVPSFTVMFAFFLTTAIADTLFTEKEEGSFRRLLAAPVPRGAIIAGKMLAYTLVVCLQAAVMFGVASVLFAMPLGGSPLGLVLVTLALGIAVTSLGMLIASLGRTRSQAVSIGMVLGFVLAGLGGAFPLGSMTPLFRREGFLATLSNFTPHAQALEGYLRVLNEGAGVVEVLPQVAVLVGMGALFFVIAMWRFKFE